MDEVAREKGLKLFEEIYGAEIAAIMAAKSSESDEFAVEQSLWTLEFSFGKVWCREGLERKLRSCVVLGMLIAQQAEAEIKYHTIMGTRNGLSRQELEEIVYTAIPYCGFPAAAAAKRAMLEGFSAMEGGA